MRLDTERIQYRPEDHAPQCVELRRQLVARVLVYLAVMPPIPIGWKAGLRGVELALVLSRFFQGTSREYVTFSRTGADIGNHVCERRKISDCARRICHHETSIYIWTLRPFLPLRQSSSNTSWSST